jgi:hypothetical protein
MEFRILFEQFQEGFDANYNDKFALQNLSPRENNSDLSLYSRVCKTKLSYSVA